MKINEDPIVGVIKKSEIKGKPAEIGLLVSHIVHEVRQNDELANFFKKDADVNANISNEVYELQKKLENVQASISDEKTKSKLDEISDGLFSVIDKLDSMTDIHDYCSGIKSKD